MSDAKACDPRANATLPPIPRKTRAHAAEDLTALGYPICKGRLAKLAMKGLGPEYSIWGNRAIYEVEKLVAWAKARDRAPRACTSRHPSFI